MIYLDGKNKKNGKQTGESNVLMLLIAHSMHMSISASYFFILCKHFPTNLLTDIGLNSKGADLQWQNRQENTECLGDSWPTFSHSVGEE